MKTFLLIVAGFFIPIGIIVLAMGFSPREGTNYAQVASGIGLLVSGLFFSLQVRLLEVVEDIEKTLGTVQLTLEDMEKTMNVSTRVTLEKIHDELKEKEEKKQSNPE